jgi:hypothetical protein
VQPVHTTREVIHPAESVHQATNVPIRRLAQLSVVTLNTLLWAKAPVQPVQKVTVAATPCSLLSVALQEPGLDLMMDTAKSAQPEANARTVKNPPSLAISTPPDLQRPNWVSQLDSRKLITQLLLRDANTATFGMAQMAALSVLLESTAPILQRQLESPV